MSDIANQVDWPFLKNGPTTLFMSQDILDDAICKLSGTGYTIHRIDCSTDNNFLLSLIESLCWQRQFGYLPKSLNLDALNDAVRGEPFDSSDRAVIVFDQFQGYWKRDKATAFQVLDIFASASRDYLIFGKCLLSFVKVSNPNFHIDALGATSTNWNNRELLNKDRGL
ncbi:MAG: barstar family protein [Paracoccaceae bacterium]